MKYIYYDSKTGNVERFINKIRPLKNWIFIKINEETVAENKGHLVTFTTNFGEVSKTTENAIKYIVMAPAKKIFSFNISEENITQLKVISKLYLNSKLEKEYKL